MDPILYQVAKAYLKNETDSLMDCCFVFPNKRSGIFFNKYLCDLIGKTALLPEIITISDLVSRFSSGVEASRMEQLFLLYNTYVDLLKERNLNTEITDFDQFIFWGDMLLNDFNDVDKYLVDAGQLFSNVKNLKEISSNFLTPEQIEVISMFWDISKGALDVETFWRHANDSKNELSGYFIHLWELIEDLYLRFGDRLRDRGLCYSGMSYREAAEQLKSVLAEQLEGKRYVFVGFNLLSTSEIKIFQRLAERGCADFYWDCNSPAFSSELPNKASRFIGKYMKMFQSRYPLQEMENREFPSIRVIGIPSNIGQTKEVSQIIDSLVKEGEIKDAENALDTAIVLPDEELFIPLLHSIPSSIKSVNITMGYPMRHTTVATLIGNIVSMQMRSRTVKGEMQFFYQDVQNLLSHPLIRLFLPRECEEITSYINDKRRFTLPESFFAERHPALCNVFFTIKDPKDKKEIFSHVRNLIMWIKDSLVENQGDKIDIGFIDHYLDAVDHLEGLTDKYSINLGKKNFFNLIERIIGSECVNFVGEPLKGLQVMGVLETRALDFDNVIMLSMNERVFPRKHYANTFIPNALRQGYGMSTMEYQESLYAYHFYRILSRAKKVFLLYDARSTGLRSGEMSRYLYQLKYLYKIADIRFMTVNYDMNIPNNRLISVTKTPEILEKLNRYLTPGSKCFFSASALNKYINCPLSFYLQYVEGLSCDDEITEYMNESTYGTIVHEVAEKLYGALKGEHDEALVTGEILEHLKSNGKMIMRQIVRSVNDHYNNLGKENDTPLTGEAKILSEIMQEFVSMMFEKEKPLAPFSFVNGEKKMDGIWNVTDKIPLNFKLIIDRIDRKEDGTLRFTDYKTGSDKSEAASIESMFDRDKTDRPKAIFQLFLYCCAYAEFTGYSEAIQPYIYLLKKISTDELGPIKLDKQPLMDYREYKDQFMEQFKKLCQEIFDPNMPFVQATTEKACTYCKFTAMCNHK